MNVLINQHYELEEKLSCKSKALNKLKGVSQAVDQPINAKGVFAKTSIVRSGGNQTRSAGINCSIADQSAKQF